MMGNVIFYLGDTTKVCFETHEAELASLDICKEKLQIFSRNQSDAKQKPRRISRLVPRRPLNRAFSTFRMSWHFAEKSMRTCRRQIRSDTS